MLEKIKEEINLLIKLNCYSKTEVAEKIGYTKQSFYTCIKMSKKLETLIALRDKVREAITELNKTRFKVDWKSEIESLYTTGGIVDIPQLYFYKVVTDETKQLDVHLVDLYRIYMNDDNLTEITKESVREVLRRFENENIM